VDLEGAVHIGLAIRAGSVERVAVTSTRPDVASALLRGRRRSDIEAALPRVFSVCGHSQAAAGELACAAAQGERISDGALARCRAEVAAETVREHAWRVLLDWPRRIDEQPAASVIAAARAAEVSRARATPLVEDEAHAIAIAAFGVGAGEWLTMRSARELDRWIDAGRTAAARFMRRTRDEEAAGDFDTARRDAVVPFLHEVDEAAAMETLWSACEADAGFPRRPTWNGRPAETGPLARLQGDPLLGDLTQRFASRTFARFVARLREFARLLAGGETARVGARTLRSGAGAAWVENARGLLVHKVRLDGECATTYRIVAPTEWNFHPAGVMAASLVGASAADRGAIEQHAVRMAQSLDPCVACRVELADA